MTASLIDLAVPGLGSALDLLRTLHDKYSELKEGQQLCQRLEQRLTDFAHELHKLPPKAFHAQQMLQHLRTLIDEFLNTVTTFAALNLAMRALKMSKFKDAIKTHHESLDHIIKMVVVTDSQQIARLLNWRAKFEEDAVDMARRLLAVEDLVGEIWEALDRMKEESMATKRDFEAMVMLIKRDICNPDRTPEPHESVLRDIIRVAEKEFLDGVTVKTPPTWLIASDEVTTVGDPIDSEGLTCVFVGEWQGARVAVKKSRIVANDSPVFDKHFRVWSTLLHPHVVQLFGAGMDHGAPFFVYEYASRLSLDRCWESLSRREVFRMLHQAALGLLYLHRKHIVHGNLSCAKLLVTDEGTIKLFGFGASYVRQDGRSNSVKVDTDEEFAAPECVGLLDGVRHSPRLESDVYSFGLTILQAISRSSPFVGCSSRDIRTMKQHNQLSRPASVDDETWSLVNEMCVFDPDGRVSLEYVIKQLRRLGG